ncbi:nucleoside triphosphate pyrophosphohydrolase [Spirulina sp. CS-785/01]|uniref:nucleoside triphosphate pyrophosphohydrolase n=1 Tax=Spirulina sp. CS-785/01 TaxID=3021716 RepID=UPI00232ECC9B|nr:nucleoside triphosphate pyrophosphohydrolase [Spirulina sp. CS-785/01]MDB9315961.1 nucleoside triphosphate pyrophosphohydrolase [Spirulina sp. CS-785/01]
MADSPETLAALQELIDVVAQLRSPDGGCPWDLQQTPQSLIPYIIEEAYETVAALQEENTADITEELGDLLLQVVLQAQIAQEYQQFNLATVARGISEKLIRRHPHVFGEMTVENVEEVRNNWEQIKAEEKGETPDENRLLSRKLNRYARTLPPLLASQKMSKKAAATGLEWDEVKDVWAKFEEELQEFREALRTKNPVEQEAELGDLLFTLVNLARWYNLDPSQALQGTNRRFIQRLEKMEAYAQRPLEDYTLAELDQFWQQAKRQLAQGY